MGRGTSCQHTASGVSSNTDNGDHRASPEGAEAEISDLLAGSFHYRLSKTRPTREECLHGDGGRGEGEAAAEDDGARPLHRRQRRHRRRYQRRRQDHLRA